MGKDKRHLKDRQSFEQENKHKRHPKVAQALKLDGNKQAIKNFYAHWASDYDDDTSDLRYTACELAYRLFISLPKSDFLHVDIHDKSIRIMDVGCGTGLMGRTLYQNGYATIDGCDLSLEMTQEAAKLNIYDNLTSNININKSINPDWKNSYDCCFSVGVFTPGHFEPTALNQIIDMTKPGGLIVLSTRLAYYETSDYQQVSDQLEHEKKVKLLKVEKNQPYTNDSTAHYWAYAVM